MTETTAIHEAYWQAVEADSEWMKEIHKSLNGHAGTLRYTKAAEGNPGSNLRAAFIKWRSAQDAYLKMVNAI